jgi:hypothetical protein
VEYCKKCNRYPQHEFKKKPRLSLSPLVDDTAAPIQHEAEKIRNQNLRSTSIQMAIAKKENRNHHRYEVDGNMALYTGSIILAWLLLLRSTSSIAYVIVPQRAEATRMMILIGSKNKNEGFPSCSALQPEEAGTTSSTRLYQEKRTYRFSFQSIPIFKRYRARVWELFRRLPFLAKKKARATSTTSSSLNDSYATSISEKDAYTQADQAVQSPNGARWAVASNTTDLSGSWRPIVTSAFKNEYDEYLQKCGEGFFFRRNLLLSVIGIATEKIDQRDNGRALSIAGETPIGRGWERVLVASGTDCDSDDYEPIFATFKDPDGDTVQVEAWWEENGTVHKSWLRNKPRVMGGEFESTRYLESENVLVCRAVFHPPPNNPKFQPASVDWQFQRNGTS